MTRGAVIQLAGGVDAVHDTASCGHLYKIPTWAIGLLERRALCDHCSTPKQRDAWDARIATLARPQRASVVTCDLARFRAHPISLPVFVICQCCERVARHDSDYCSPRCERASRFEPRTCAHPDCDQTYRSGYANQRCCTPKHNRALYRIEHPEQWPVDSLEDRRERWQRRRALKKGASTGDPVRILEIAKRDGWTCQLCLKPVDPSVVWPDPMSKSLDHVVALARGGAHDPSNAQLAHLRCNVAKGSTG